MIKQELQKLINGSMFADLGYVDAEGNPCIRKVFCTWHKGLGEHLISTNFSSKHVQALQRNGSACLYFDDTENFKAICLNGKVIVHGEEYYKRLLWTEGDEQYYPGGIEDEDYCVLEFVAESARCYGFGDGGSGDISQKELAEDDETQKLKNCFGDLTAG